ncbi:MAG TPA: response regulator, partial [Spirochaetota bacterium]
SLTGDNSERLTMSHDYSLFNSMNFPVCVIGADGQLAFFNTVFRETILGTEDTATLDFHHPFYPEYRKRIALSYQRAREGENTKCFAVIRSPSGSQLPVEIYLYPIQNDVTNSDILAYFISVDNRVASFNDFASSLSGTEFIENINIFEFSPFPIIRFDKDFNILAISASSEEMTGIARDEILATPQKLFSTLLPFDVERLKRNIAEIFNGNAAFRRVNDLKVTPVKGGDRWTNVVIYPIYREKKKILVEILFEDITRIKALENKVSSLGRVQIISDLTKGLLHTFNNFTNVIINRSQMLLSITEKRSVTDGLNVIHKAAIDGARQIKRVQDFIGEGDRENATGSSELIEVIEDAIEFARIHFKVERKEKGRMVSIAKQYFAKDRVQGQIKLLREIFVSMIFRVAAFIDNQGVVETELRRDEDLVVTISTSTEGHTADQGTGNNPMSEIEIRRIAEKINVRIFEEVSADRYLIRAIIPSSMIVGPEKLPREEEGVKIRDLDILVVEDETALQEILFELFDHMGNRVSVCENGDDALNEFRHNKYDIVISDYGIPGMTGLELLKKVRELNEHTTTVLLSGWLLDDVARYEKTIDLFLSKPFHIEALIREISKLLKK